MAVMEKMVLKFTPQEFNAIVQLSIAEHREPRQQAAYIIRQALEQLGFLPPTPTPQRQEVIENDALPRV